MSKVKVLNHDVISEILDMKQVIKVIEQVYTLKAEGKAELFPMVFHEFERGVADMDIKSGFLKDANFFGLKLVSWFGENAKKNMSPIIGTTLVFDAKTGKPLGLLNAEHITGMRTGAAGAIGAKYLARKDSEDLLIVGTGHQSAFQIAATLIAMDNIKKVRIYEPMGAEKAVTFVQSIGQVLKKEFLSKYKEDKQAYNEIAEKFNVIFEPIQDIKAAVGESDIIITATPSRKPMIDAEWVKPGTHFSCVGSDMEGKQEIDENIFAKAKVYVDDINQAINVGETEIPIKKRIISKADIVGEIGSLMIGKIDGRTSNEDITIYDTTGIALQDLMTAKLALDIAEKKNLGVEVNL